MVATPIFFSKGTSFTIPSKWHAGVEGLCGLHLGYPGEWTNFFALFKTIEKMAVQWFQSIRAVLIEMTTNRINCPNHIQRHTHPTRVFYPWMHLNCVLMILISSKHKIMAEERSILKFIWLFTHRITKLLVCYAFYWFVYIIHYNIIICIIKHRCRLFDLSQKCT